MFIINMKLVIIKNYLLYLSLNMKFILLFICFIMNKFYEFLYKIL